MSYDQYYQTEELFGAPYPELMAFFEGQEQWGKVLDLGCGQGRDALPLARMGYSVTGMDISKVGIGQMNAAAESEGLEVEGLVADIYAPMDYSAYDFILLNSMFHFEKKDRQREIGLIKSILGGTKKGTQVVFCVPDQKKKQEILNETIGEFDGVEVVLDQPFTYVFQDDSTGHSSKTVYKLKVVSIGN